MKLEPSIAQAFEDFARRGPVNYGSAQRKAHKAWKLCKHVFTDAERADIGIALGHALGATGIEGRAEFDRVIKRTRERITRLK